MCEPAVALQRLVPETPHHLVQSKIYLTWDEHRGVKRCSQPEKDIETLSQEAPKERNDIS